jgi:hypothetical protein
MGLSLGKIKSYGLFTHIHLVNAQGKLIELKVM